MEIRSGNQSLTHFSRRTLVRTAKSIYNEDMDKIFNSLRDIEYVATTADVWSTKRRRLLGTTIHWV